MDAGTLMTGTATKTRRRHDDDDRR